MDDIKAWLYGHWSSLFSLDDIFIWGFPPVRLAQMDALRIYDGKYLFNKISFYFKNVQFHILFDSYRF